MITPLRADGSLHELESADLDARLDAGTLELTYIGDENTYAVDAAGIEYYAKDSRRIKERNAARIAEYNEPPDTPTLKGETRPCPECSSPMFYHAPNADEYGGYLCGACDCFVRTGTDDYDPGFSDNGPTGHGDICHSDADPGL